MNARNSMMTAVAMIGLLAVCAAPVSADWFVGASVGYGHGYPGYARPYCYRPAAYYGAYYRPVVVAPYYAPRVVYTPAYVPAPVVVAPAYVPAPVYYPAPVYSGVSFSFGFGHGYGHGGYYRPAYHGGGYRPVYHGGGYRSYGGGGHRGGHR